MSNLARKLDELDVFQTMGKIVRIERDGGNASGGAKKGAVLVVRTNRGDLRAKRAVGCLVEPREQDFVLVAGDPHGACYVLSVLEREGEGTAIACDGDLDIKLTSGKLRVASQEGIDLVSAKEVSVAAGGFNVHAGAASFVLGQLSYLGSVVRAELEKAKLTSGILDTVVDRVSQRVKRSFRTVEEIDQVKAERIDYAANQTMTLRGENTLVTAKELVKMDGEQIHMG
jgi:hypothetical protein